MISFLPHWLIFFFNILIWIILCNSYCARYWVLYTFPVHGYSTLNPNNAFLNTILLKELGFKLFLPPSCEDHGNEWAWNQMAVVVKEQTAPLGWKKKTIIKCTCNVLCLLTVKCQKPRQFQYYRFINNHCILNGIRKTQKT